MRNGTHNKFMVFLKNKTIIICIILVFILLTTITWIYLQYNELNTIISIFATSLFTLFFVIIWETYSSENKRNAIINAFYDELTENLIVSLENNNLLLDELHSLNSGEMKNFVMCPLTLNNYEQFIQKFPEKVYELDYISIKQYISNSKDFNRRIKYKIKLRNNLNSQIDVDKYLITKISVLVEYICIILGPNLIVAELDGSDKNSKEFKVLNENQYLKNYLKYKIKIARGYDYNKTKSKDTKVYYIKT